MSRSGRLRRLLGSLALLLCSFLGSVALGAAVTFAATTKASNSSSSSATTTNDRHIQEQRERMHLKVLLKQEFLDRVPSCRHTFSQIELTNTVSFSFSSFFFSSVVFGQQEREEEKMSLHFAFGLVWSSLIYYLRLVYEDLFFFGVYLREILIAILRKFCLSFCLLERLTNWILPTPLLHRVFVWITAFFGTYYNSFHSNNSRRDLFNPIRSF